MNFFPSCEGCSHEKGAAVIPSANIDLSIDTKTQANQHSLCCRVPRGMQVHIRKTKQPFHKRMVQHRRATSSGQDLAVCLRLKETADSFERQPGSCTSQRRSLLSEGCQRSHPWRVGKKHLWTEVVHLCSPTYNAVLHSQRSTTFTPSHRTLWLITM